MTASVLVGTADTTPTSSYNYSTVAHASTTVGTPLVLIVTARMSDVSGGTNTITVPSGWTLLDRIEEQQNAGTGPEGSANDCIFVIAAYTKIAASGDLSPNTINVTFGTKFSTLFNTDNRIAQVLSVDGGVSVTGAAADSSPPSTSGSWTPDGPTVSAHGIGIWLTRGTIGSGSASPWSSVYSHDGFTAYSLGPQSPPHTMPTFTRSGSSSNGVVSISMLATDTPESTGFRLGALGFGARGPGF